MSTSAPALHINHREIHARTFALDKARDVRGVIVDLVLQRTGSTGFDRRVVEGIEADMERRLAALIKNSVMEFTDMYIADLERRLEAMQRQEDRQRELEKINPQPQVTSLEDSLKANRQKV